MRHMLRKRPASPPANRMNTRPRSRQRCHAGSQRRQAVYFNRLRYAYAAPIPPVAGRAANTPQDTEKATKKSFSGGGIRIGVDIRSTTKEIKKTPNEPSTFIGAFPLSLLSPVQLHLTNPHPVVVSFPSLMRPGVQALPQKY